MNLIWIKRVLAFVAAVALVVAAVTIRKSWDDGDTSSPSPTTDGGSGGEVVVACVTDLAEWCNALAVDGVTVRVEPWTTTVKSLQKADAPDGWITLDPLGGLADGYTAGDPIATSQLIAVGRADRMNAAVNTCGADGFWKCAGAQAGASWTTLGGQASWNKVLLGLPDPNASAIGALSLGAASASYFGTTSFGSTQIDSNDDFFTWFSAIVKSVPNEALTDPVALVLQRPSAVGLVAGTAQHRGALVGSRADDFPATYPGPMASADVVIAVRDGSKLPGALTKSLGTALIADGWAAPTGATTALPSARALVRLAGLWKDVRS